ncbi:MAG TPA: DUF4190 domain-containing protein [Candidatus Paceibacterota bacterium]|nr:DUF4190 domain-containing protein [Candidatus Paceibacterota bacterium]
MSENTPPPFTGNQPPSQTSGLAIWSLVLGILSLCCFTVFSGIPGVICGHTALSRIKRSGGMLGGQGLAIAGLVTGYMGIALAIFIIPMLAAIAIPNFVKARQTAQQNICIHNLRQIDAAKNSWATEKGKQPNEIPTAEDLKPYIPGNLMPMCPAGGEYRINAVEEHATCSVPKHELQDPL